MQEYQVTGRVVIVAAGACESSRLLLNSKSARHQNGLANSSGVVGKYLHDSTGAALGGYLPTLFGRKDITKMELVACMFILPGGLIIRNWIFPVVII
jgi:hypothetical protein